MSRSETAVAAGFALFGLTWVIKALDLPYMGEFAPGSGFLPLWLGVTLTGLSLVLIARRWRVTAAEPAEPRAATGGWRKPALVAAGLWACIGAISFLGFLISVTTYLVWLLRIVERRSWAVSLAIGVGTPVLLVAAFRAGLGVPLPLGPLGF